MTTSHPAQREVECPSCHHRQDEVETVIGTLCRACRESFAVPPQPTRGRGKTVGVWARMVGVKVRDGWSGLCRRWRTEPATARLRRGRFVTTPFTLEDGREGDDGGAAVVAGSRRVACPYCQAPALLPARALTNACAECGSHYPLKDHDIYGEIQANLVTAGKVVVHFAGHLVATSVRCGELSVYGQADGALTVTGRAEYHGRGEAVGELHCGHLLVVRGAHRVFHQRVFAMAADIHGEVTGDVCCAGRLHISRGGAVHGAVLAGQIAIDEGGRLNGSMATLPAVLRPGARLTETARELLHNFGQDEP